MLFCSIDSLEQCNYYVKTSFSSGMPSLFVFCKSHVQQRGQRSLTSKCIHAQTHMYTGNTADHNKPSLPFKSSTCNLKLNLQKNFEAKFSVKFQNIDQDRRCLPATLFRRIVANQQKVRDSLYRLLFLLFLKCRLRSGTIFKNILIDNGIKPDI